MSDREAATLGAPGVGEQEMRQPLLRTSPQVAARAAACARSRRGDRAPTAAAQTLQKGFWGPTEIDGVSQFPVYEELGVTIFQMQLPWAAVAPTRPADPRNPADPAYRWPAEIDRAIAEARSHGMSVLLMPIGAPPWANGGHTHGVRAAPAAGLRRLRARRLAPLPGRAALDDLGRAVALDTTGSRS